MKKSLIAVSLIATAAAPALMQAAPAVYFKADFENGSLPSGMSVERTGAALDRSVYSVDGITDAAWSVQAMKSGMAAVCGSFTGSSQVTEGVMSTPEFEVGGTGALIRWDARSMLAGFPESYKVVAYESGNPSPYLLKEINGEEHSWRGHVASLARFAGKKIRVEFRCTSSDKYLLAIDNIWAGEDEEESFFTADRTLRYQKQSAKGVVALDVLNTGSTVKSMSVDIFEAADGVVSDKKLAETIEISDWTIGGWRRLEFSIDPREESKVEYAVVTRGGSELASGTVRFSAYERRRVVKEPTGMTCNNCPQGTVRLEDFEHEFGDQLIVIKPHANDMFLDADYWSPMGVFSMPCFIMDQSKTYRSQSVTNIDKFLEGFDTPTFCDIRVTGHEYDPDFRSLGFYVEVDFSKDIDNSDDRYRTAMTVTYDVYRPTDVGTIFQSNQGSGRNVSLYDVYRYLPPTLPAPLVKLDRIPVFNSSCYEGIEETIPAYVAAGETVETAVMCDVPESVGDINNAYAVVYVVDSQTHDILNAVEIPLGSISGTGISRIHTDSNRLRIFLDGSDLCVSGLDATDGECKVRIYSADGTLMAVREVSATDSRCDISGLKGMVIVRAEASGKTSSGRFAVK